MSEPTVSARLFKLGVGLFLVAAGLAGAVLLFIPWRRAMETRAWTETPCVITESYRDEQRVSELAQPVHRVFIRYRYSFGGKEYTGHRWRRVSFTSSDDKDVARKTPHSDEAQKLAVKFPPGLATTCWVNPKAPSEAVLEHHTKAALYTVWWPLLFALGGGGMVYSALRKGAPAAGAQTTDGITHSARTAPPRD
jgi:hypothetical protein